MPAVADINLSTILATTLLSTDAAVGVNRTFSPDGNIQPGVMRWVDRSGGIALGYPWLSLSVRPPTKDSRITRVQAKLVVPTLEVTSPSTMTGIQPQPTKAYDCTFNGEFMLPERSTLAERTLLFSLAKSLYAVLITASDGTPSNATGSPLSAAVLNGEQVWGG